MIIISYYLRNFHYIFSCFNSGGESEIINTKKRSQLPRKNEGILIILSYLSEIVSENLSKHHEIQDNHLLLPSYKVDNTTDDIVKEHRAKKTRKNDNNNDVLANRTSNCKIRVMIIDHEYDIARLFAIGLERNGFVVCIIKLQSWPL